MQLSALQEICNIGAGNAATSLSGLMNKEVGLSVPNVNVISIEEMLSKNAEEIVTAILISLSEDIGGFLLIVFDKSAKNDIIKTLSFNPEDTGLDSEMNISILEETGNIIASSFLGSLMSMTGLKSSNSVPALCEDVLYSILSSILIEVNQEADEALELETDLTISGERINGHVYLLPTEDSLEKIFAALGVA